LNISVENKKLKLNYFFLKKTMIPGTTLAKPPALFHPTTLID